jgi:DNA-binding NarL/FixJ family response regulator
MKQNILLILNDARVAGAVRDSLMRSRDRDFHVEWVRTCAIGLERLAFLGKQHLNRPSGIAAVLVDLLLPDVTGIETFEQLFAAIPQIPNVILSSVPDEAKTPLSAPKKFFKP